MVKCEILQNQNGKQYVDDDRLDGLIEYHHDDLIKLKECYIKSHTLNDLLVCIPKNIKTNHLCVIRQHDEYILGVL